MRGRRAPDYLREHVLASAGLLPLPEKTPLRPSIFGEVTRADYRVSKVYFESLPGFFVTGNLYRPIGDGPFPAVLSPHGHWTYGRLENTALTSGPGRAIGLARQGFVVFTYDMVGYNDSQQLPHTFGGRRESLWGLSLAGLQLWNGIRALDFLETLPDVRRDALARDRRVRRRHADVPARGRRSARQGGRAGQHDLAPHAGRLPVREPARPPPRHDQRRDRRDDRAAAAADGLGDRATGRPKRWRSEYPAVRAVYELFGAADRVQAVRIDGRAQLQQGQPRGDVRVDGALAAEAPAGRPSCAERSFTRRAALGPARVPSAARCHAEAVTAGAADRRLDRRRQRSS